MTPDTQEAVTDRFAGDGEDVIRALVRPQDFALSPEEYVARNAHNWLLFSYHFYSYRDAALGAWVRRVGELLSASEAVERCRRKYLTPDEYDAVIRDAAEGF